MQPVQEISQTLELQRSFLNIDFARSSSSSISKARPPIAWCFPAFSVGFPDSSVVLVIIQGGGWGGGGC